MGNLIGVVAVATDVTEEKRARLALLEEQRVLGVLNRTAVKLNAELGPHRAHAGGRRCRRRIDRRRIQRPLLRRMSREDDHFALYAVSGIDRAVLRDSAVAA